MRTSVSVDDFLKQVFLIGYDDGVKVTSSVLARVLQVSNPAVTDMARKLSRKGLVKYEPYKALSLTVKGRAKALELVRRHRLWETFLHRVLDLDLQSIHTEAEKLEHQSSPALIEKIAEFLANPSFDPHGDPIPDAKGKIPSMPGVVRLSELGRGDKGTIVRLDFKEIDNSLFYDKNAVTLDGRILVVSKDTRTGAMEAEMDGNIFYVSQRMANRIYIKTEKL